MNKRLSLTLLGLMLALATAPVCAAEVRDAAVYRGWIEDMKAAAGQDSRRAGRCWASTATPMASRCWT